MICASPVLLAIQLELLLDPSPEWPEEGRNHVKAALFDGVVRGHLWLGLVLPPERRQVRQLVPVDFGDLFARARLKVCVHGHTAEDIEHHALLAHCDGDAFHLLLGQD
jgi:hypothetical protein